MKRALLALGIFLSLASGAAAQSPSPVSIPDSVFSRGTITTTGSSNGVMIQTNGRSTVGLDVSGTFSGSLLVQGSVDYGAVGPSTAHWGVTTAVSLTNGTINNAITTAGQYQINAAGFSAIRIYAVALVSGTPAIAMIGSSGVSTVMADNPFPSTCTVSTCVFASGPYAYTPLTPMQAGLAVASSTTLTIPSTSTYAVVCARGQNINYTTDGTTTPTASVGMQLLVNQCVSLSGPTVLSNFKAIQQAASATIDVSYFK